MRVLVARRQRDLARAEQPLRLGAVRRPALEQAGRGHRPALRVGHAVPVDRRPGVQQHPILEPVDHLAGRRDRHGLRLRRLDPPDDLPVGRVDALAVGAPQPLEHPDHPRVAAGGRAPVDIEGCAALLAHRRTERRETHVHRRDARREGVGHTRPPVTDLARLAEIIRTAPGLLGKRELALIAHALPHVDGDDASVLALGDGHVVLAGEAIVPWLVESDPFAAGAAAVVTNVSDVRAMGGRPLGLVDTVVSPDRGHAERVLEGLAWAADLLGVEVVGGHLTLGGPPALSAFCTGVVTTPLRASRARPGDTLVAAFCVEGRYAGPPRSSAPCATARPSSCATTARRSSRPPSAGSRTPRATCRCRASGIAAPDARAGRLRRDTRPRPAAAPAACRSSAGW